MLPNCLASTSIGCLFCYKGCNAEKLRNAFTFVPPQPSYDIEADAQDADKGKIVYRLEGLVGSQLYRQAAESSEVSWVNTRKGTRIPLVRLRRPLAPDRPQELPPVVLLHCHGNATDIGMMMGPYYQLAKIPGVEVCGVEYSAYGASTDPGTPSSGKTCSDVEAAYDYLISQGIPGERIVAYGQSVGSGPVSHLSGCRKLGGLVLHSPLLSGIKVVDPHPDKCCRPSCVFHCFDFYPNDRRAREATCPVFIMHGQRDDVVPFYHGMRLHQACPPDQRWPPYFPARAGHNDIVETDMRGYFMEVASFLLDVQRKAAGLPSLPKSAERPYQLEMMEGLSGGGDKKRPSGAKQVPSPQVIGAGGVVPTGGAVEMTTAPAPTDGEPRMMAGPEDGRYEQLRAGNVKVPGPRAGEAREVELVEPRQAVGL